MLPVRPEMQKAGPSTRVTVPPAPRDGLADDVHGLVTGAHVTRRRISTTAVVELEWGHVCRARSSHRGPPRRDRSGRNSAGRVTLRGAGRGPCADGPQRLREVDPGQDAAGQPQLRAQLGPGRVEG